MNKIEAKIQYLSCKKLENSRSICHEWILGFFLKRGWWRKERKNFCPQWNKSWLAFSESYTLIFKRSLRLCVCSLDLKLVFCLNLFVLMTYAYDLSVWSAQLRLVLITSRIWSVHFSINMLMLYYKCQAEILVVKLTAIFLAPNFHPLINMLFRTRKYPLAWIIIY